MGSVYILLYFLYSFNIYYENQFLFLIFTEYTHDPEEFGILLEDQVLDLSVNFSQVSI